MQCPQCYFKSSSFLDIKCSASNVRSNIQLPSLSGPKLYLKKTQRNNQKYQTFSLKTISRICFCRGRSLKHQHLGDLLQAHFRRGLHILTEAKSRQINLKTIAGDKDNPN